MAELCRLLLVLSNYNLDLRGHRARLHTGIVSHSALHSHKLQPLLYNILHCTLHSPIIMSRASSSNQRNLTLTEELERLEQSITLTLQGIYISGWFLVTAPAAKKR